MRLANSFHSAGGFPGSPDSGGSAAGAPVLFVDRGDEHDLNLTSGAGPVQGKKKQ